MLHLFPFDVSVYSISKISNTCFTLTDLIRYIDTTFTYWRKNMIDLETTSGWQLIYHRIQIAFRYKTNGYRKTCCYQQIIDIYKFSIFTKLCFMPNYFIVLWLRSLSFWEKLYCIFLWFLLSLFYYVFAILFSLLFVVLFSQEIDTHRSVIS